MASAQVGKQAGVGVAAAVRYGAAEAALELEATGVRAGEEGGEEGRVKREHPGFDYNLKTNKVLDPFSGPSIAILFT